MRIEADFAAFLPPSATPEERLLISQLREGLVARLMLVALHGADEKTLAQASRAVADRLGHDPAFVEAIIRRVRLNQYKRRPPVIAKLSARTIDREFRYPRDWGV